MNCNGAVVDSDFWTSWVPAAPFRAWLNFLADATGFDPGAIAVAAGVSTGVGRSLASGGRHSQRIRSLDARGLLSLDVEALQWHGSRLTDAGLAHKALADLGELCPAPEDLARLLGVGEKTAQGLVTGELRLCRREVLWHCLALTQGILSAIGDPACRP